eukprot:TRINITY_DN4241_c0_g1_i7.p1 TRINITY_DN4241_c0_g1~~TRINITY_DN4241_c0_g1_i7.p1  ORF type:complete len:637 (-),score=160.86 TRINITY_DN4241_c0_g1_i7:97-2007(-)
MTDTPPTPLPYKQLLPLCLVLLTDTINACSLYPYLNFMVQGYHVAPDDKHVGYYVGVLASSYFLAQFLSSFLWGWLSDRLGRRVCLLFGLLGSTIATVTFGMAPSFVWAVVARFLAGGLNGNVGVAKSMLGEITDTTNQAKAFSYFGLSWGVGGVLGPLVGGYLSFPATKYPSLFRDTSGTLYVFFSSHPYVLPNIIGGSLTFLGLIIGFFVLKETHKNILEKSNPNSLKKTHSSSSSARFKRLSTSSSSSSSANNDEPTNLQHYAGAHVSVHDNPDLVEIDLLASPANDNFITRLWQKIRPSSSAHKFQHVDGDDGDDNDDTDTLVKEENDLNKKQEEEDTSVGISLDDGANESELDRMIAAEASRSIWKDKEVLGMCGLYAFLGFTFIIWEEVFPLWLFVATEDGGLGFTSSDIGFAQACAGTFSILFQAFCYPHIIKRLGLMRAFQVGTVLGVPTFIAIPFVSKIINPNIPANKQWGVWGFVLPLMLLIQSVSEVTFISTIIMVSNAAIPAHMGTVNGIGQSLVSFCRTVGPATGSSLLSWSLIQGSQIGFPMDKHLIFFVEALLLCVLLFISFHVGTRFDVQKVERLKACLEERDKMATMKEFGHHDDDDRAKTVHLEMDTLDSHRIQNEAG